MWQARWSISFNIWSSAKSKQFYYCYALWWFKETTLAKWCKKGKHKKGMPLHTRLRQLRDLHFSVQKWFISHSLHMVYRVAEEIQRNYPGVDKIISIGKKELIKASLWVQKIKYIAPTLALPPQPVMIHWGTWMDAAIYYSTNYDSLQWTNTSFLPP